jgi:hypothetical protein
MAMAARIPMIATTIISSMRVKPFWILVICVFSDDLKICWRSWKKPAQSGAAVHARTLAGRCFPGYPTPLPVLQLLSKA